MSDTERERFEAFYRRKHRLQEMPLKDGRYLHDEDQHSWEVWQAALSQRQPPDDAPDQKEKT